MLYLHHAAVVPKDEQYLKAATLQAFPKLKDALDGCKPTGASIQSLAAVIVPVVGKLLFDLYVDKQARDLEALKESSEKSYHARAVLRADGLSAAVSGGHCFVVTRTTDDDAVPQFVAVLALSRAPKELVPGQTVEAFTFRPTYAAARSAVAVTRKADKPKISTSFAVSVRAIGIQDNKLPAFAQVGEAAVTVPGMVLSNAIRPDNVGCTKECPASDPIPLVPGTGTLAVGIGVTEKGETGIDFDAATSELSAIKAAIGPMISEVLKEKLK
ncbi:hypothetical protein ASF45_32190 [Pseudorhodoferax sp. Leaf265]|nr:hypothetical protein ASF45_32190 [Pseudorhodoferax sp. Leaf265]